MRESINNNSFKGRREDWRINMDVITESDYKNYFNRIMSSISNRIK